MRPEDDLFLQRTDESLGDAVGLGSRTKTKLGTMPKNFSWFGKCSDMKGLPWSWRIDTPRAASARTEPKTWLTASASAAAAA
jgi:hypothetical protein